MLQCARLLKLRHIIKSCRRCLASKVDKKRKHIIPNPQSNILDPENIIQQKDPAIIKILKTEYEVLCRTEFFMPMELTSEILAEICTCKNRKHRLQVYEKHALKTLKSLREKNTKPSETSSRTRSAHNYALMHKLWLASQFSPNVVVDLGSEKNMDPYVLRKSMHGLELMFAANSKYIEPFNIIFANTEKDSVIKSQLKEHLKYCDDSFFTPKSYLDLFPKETLRYITAFEGAPLTKYDPTKNYIISAAPQILSMSLARRLNIQKISFPLTDVSPLKDGSKRPEDLDRQNIINMLHCLKYTNNYNWALQALNFSSSLKYSDCGYWEHVVLRNKEKNIRNWLP